MERAQRRKLIKIRNTSCCRTPSLRGLGNAQCTLWVTPAVETSYANGASTRKPREVCVPGDAVGECRDTGCSSSNPVPRYCCGDNRSGRDEVLVISEYDPDEGEDVTERDRELHRKLALIRQAIDDTRRVRGEDVEVLLCADFSRHNVPWGAPADIVRRRRDEGVPIIHLAHEYSLRSMVPNGTITWQHRWSLAVDSRCRPSQRRTCSTAGPLWGARKRPRVGPPADRHPFRCLSAASTAAGSSYAAGEGGLGADREGHHAETQEPLPTRSGDTGRAGKCRRSFQRIVVDVVHCNVPRARPSPDANRLPHNQSISIRLQGGIAIKQSRQGNRGARN